MLTELSDWLQSVHMEDSEGSAFSTNAEVNEGSAWWAAVFVNSGNQNSMPSLFNSHLWKRISQGREIDFQPRKTRGCAPATDGGATL